MTDYIQNLRRPANSGTFYTGDESPLDIETWSPAATSPISPLQLPNGEHQTNELDRELREQSADTDTLSRRLSRTASDIKPVLTAAPSSLQPRIDDWCRQHGYDPDQSETARVLAEHAALSLLLKGTLYEWHHQRGNVPELGDDIREAYQIANHRVDSRVFEERVLEDLIWAAESVDVQALVDERDQLLNSTQPAADIWQLYEAVTPTGHRHVLGQFRTPEKFIRLMRSWSIANSEVVLDPGMGAACLSQPFHPDWEVSTDPNHVDGIDRSPLAALMGTVAQTIAGQSHESHATDFFDLSPNDLDRDVDGVVCNPPYTRDQELPPEYKVELNAHAEELTGLAISGKSPLYAYFYYHLGQFLDEGDRAAVITPHYFFTRDYGKSLKQFLLREFDINAFLLFDPDTGSDFPNANTTGVVTFLEANSDTESAVTRFIRVDDDAEVESLHDAIRNGEQGETEWGFVNCVEQAQLDPEEKWSFHNPGTVDTSNLTPLSELAEVHRGLQTGENDVFCLSQADVDAWGIELQYLSRLVPKPRFVDGYDIRNDDFSDQKATWLLYHVADVENVPKTVYDEESGHANWSATTMETESSLSVSKYLRHVLTDHNTLPTRKSVHTREPWYRVERGETAPILIAPISRSDFRVLLNETDARHLNNYYGIYPDSIIGQAGRKALLAYLNSTFVDEIVAQHQRTYSGGLSKVEPGDVKDIPVIDPTELPGEVITMLAEYFDDLRDAARGDEDEAAIIRRIDTVLQREL